MKPKCKIRVIRAARQCMEVPRPLPTIAALLETERAENAEPKSVAAKSAFIHCLCSHIPNLLKKRHL